MAHYMTLNALLRETAGLNVRDCRPIDIVHGDFPPRQVGSSYYFTTPSGKTIVRHPNAYGWRTRYWPSTRRVEVGAAWFNALCATVAAYDAAVRTMLDKMTVRL